MRNKIIENTEKIANLYDKKLSTIVDKSSNKLTTYLDLKDKKNLETVSISERLFDWYSNLLTKYADKYDEALEPYKDLARYTTFPINWPYFLYLKIKSRRDNNILFSEGVHFFVALQGGGKSSLAYELITYILMKTGMSSYVNADFEVARFDPITRKYYKFFQFFKLMDFFNMSVRDDDPNIQVSQLKKFNRHFDTIVLDEWLTEMNHRLNKTKDYNNIFMALLTMIAHMRHQKMKRIYVLSQIDNTDIQLLSMFKYVHEVEVDLDCSYMDWVANGSLKKHIKGWNVWTYGVKRNRKKQSTDKVLIKKQYVKAEADFYYFDTLAQASKYEALPEDNIEFVRGI